MTLIDLVVTPAQVAQALDAPDDDPHGSFSQAGAYMTGDIDPSYSPGVPSSVATTANYTAYYGVDGAGRETPRPGDGRSDVHDEYQYEMHPAAGVSHRRDIDDFNSEYPPACRILSSVC